MSKVCVCVIIMVDIYTTCNNLTVCFHFIAHFSTKGHLFFIPYIKTSIFTSKAVGVGTIQQRTKKLHKVDKGLYANNI